MPIMNGYETTIAIKKLCNKKNVPEIPIIALTANDSAKDQEAGRKAGMCEYLSKPLKDKELIRILHKYCPKFKI